MFNTSSGGKKRKNENDSIIPENKKPTAHAGKDFVPGVDILPRKSFLGDKTTNQDKFTKERKMPKYWTKLLA